MVLSSRTDEKIPRQSVTKSVHFIVLAIWLCTCQILNAQTPIFTDVTREAGIEFQHTDGRSGQYYLLEELGSGAAFFDYDNDDDLDIYFVNGTYLPGAHAERQPTNALYRNNGDGTFTDVTNLSGVGDTGYGVGCCVGDFDNDGYLDIYVTNFGKNVLYRNNGDGTFSDVTDAANVGDGRWGASCAFADYDKDGDLDLYAANYVEFKLDENKVCHRGGVRTYCPPQAFEGVADVLYRNNGDGSFSEVTKEADVFNPRGRGLGVVWGDYDNDGYLDLYVANDTNENYLYRNNRDGTFSDAAFFAGCALSEHGKMESGMGVDFGDYDNDGFLDIAVTNFQNEVATLYRNNGNGFFTDVSYPSGTGEKTLPSLGWSVCFFDYDNDTDKDLFIANGHVYDNVELFDPSTAFAQTNHLFENLGNGSFEEVTDQIGTDFSRKTPSRGAVFGDYDNDGDIDILVTNSNSKPQLLRNDGGNRNNWVKVRAIGTASNRAGIGTRIKVMAGGLSQMAEVKSGSGYLGQNEIALHFGLGEFDIIDKIVVIFPSGRVREVEAVPANQLIRIEEARER